MTDLELYVWTVKTLGVPARTYHDKHGRLQMEAPFTRLEPDALERVLATVPAQEQPA